MEQAPAEAGLPPSLRFLKGLVIVLTLTMIIGVITVVAVIVTRMPDAMRSSITLPDQIILPAGTRAQSFTQGKDWFAVVTTDDRILIFSRTTGKIVQEVAIQSSAVTD